MNSKTNKTLLIAAVGLLGLGSATANAGAICVGLRARRRCSRHLPRSSQRFHLRRKLVQSHERRRFAGHRLQHGLHRLLRVRHFRPGRPRPVGRLPAEQPDPEFLGFAVPQRRGHCVCGVAGRDGGRRRARLRRNRSRPAARRPGQRSGSVDHAFRIHLDRARGRSLHPGGQRHDACSGCRRHLLGPALDGAEPATSPSRVPSRCSAWACLVPAGCVVVARSDPGPHPR